MNDKHGLFQRVIVSGDFLFKLGVFVVLSGASLTGWGCSCPCGAGADYGTAVGPCAASLVPDGACYTRVAYVPMTCCRHSFGSAFPFMFYCVLFIVYLQTFFGGDKSMLISFDLRISYCCNRISDTYTSWLQNVEQVLQVYLEIMEYDTDHINTYSHTHIIYMYLTYGTV